MADNMMTVDTGAHAAPEATTRQLFVAAIHDPRHRQIAFNVVGRGTAAGDFLGVWKA
jgi:hypothetical protein